MCYNEVYKKVYGKNIERNFMREDVHISVREIRGSKKKEQRQKIDHLVIKQLSEIYDQEN